MPPEDAIAGMSGESVDLLGGGWAWIARMPTDWERLGLRIIAMRSRRWHTRAKFAEATGVSVRVLGDLENGRRDNYLPGTLAAVETALGWAPGSCEQIVKGGKAIPETDPTLVRLLDAWFHLSPDARSLLVDLAERAPYGARQDDPER